MPLDNIHPSNTQAALAGVELVANLDAPNPNLQMIALAEPLIGRADGSESIVDVAYPVTWAYAHNADWLLVVLSGMRTARTMPTLAASYLEDASVSRNYFIPGCFMEWASQIFTLLRSRGVTERNYTYFIGHSLGGSIATALCASFITVGETMRSRSLMTFGAPKTTGYDFRPFDRNVSFIRWTNPADNVPSLPPLAEQAPLLYGPLTRRQRNSLQAWIQPIRASSISPAGIISTINDPPSLPITTTTLIAAMNSNITGVFGTGHLMPTYRAAFQAAIATASPVAPLVQTIVQAPVAAIPPVEVSPRVAPPPPNNVAIDQRFVVFRNETTTRDSAAVTIPNPLRMIAFREDRIWFVKWMEWRVCVGPTRKKAQALARHFNRFLRIYQGVGESYSNLFVLALIEYLQRAASAESGVRPILNDGGNPPEFTYTP